VTLPVVDGLPSLRGPVLYPLIEAAIGASHKPVFRITEFTVQARHIHLIVEAEDRTALGRGMAGFKIRAARAINTALSRRGAVFADRYHAVPLRTPTQTRNAIAYVLTNRRHHVPSAPRLDGCSSGPWFTGWAIPLRRRPAGPSPCARAATWLGSLGWKRAGLI